MQNQIIKIIIEPAKGGHNRITHPMNKYEFVQRWYIEFHWIDWKEENLESLQLNECYSYNTSFTTMSDTKIENDEDILKQIKQCIINTVGKSNQRDINFYFHSIRKVNYTDTINSSFHINRNITEHDAFFNFALKAFPEFNFNNVNLQNFEQMKQLEQIEYTFYSNCKFAQYLYDYIGSPFDNLNELIEWCEQ